jgi:hypothetical protein
MSYAPCCSRLPFQSVSGLRAFTLQPTSSTSYPQRRSPPPHPHFALFSTTPSYADLQVFGCACYPNTSATAPHKLAPRSCLCVFLGYSSDHKGYRCLDLTTNRLLISRHVFDESSSLFASSDPPPDDLDSLFLSSPAVHTIAPPNPSSVAGISKTVAMPCAALASRPTPRAAPTSTPAPPAAPAPTLAAPTPAWHRRRRSRLRLCHTRHRLHASPNPPCVLATTSGSRAGALPRQVVSLPPRHRGS